MVQSCSAFGCTNRYQKDRRFHRFPLNNPKQLQKWMIAVRRKDWKPNKNSVLCSDHFTADSYMPGRHYLKENAVPSIFSFSFQLQKTENEKRIIEKNPLPAEKVEAHENTKPLQSIETTSFNFKPSTALCFSRSRLNTNVIHLIPTFSGETKPTTSQETVQSNSQAKKVETHESIKQCQSMEQTTSTSFKSLTGICQPNLNTNVIRLIPAFSVETIPTTSQETLESNSQAENTETHESIKQCQSMEPTTFNFKPSTETNQPRENVENTETHESIKQFQSTEPTTSFNFKTSTGTDQPRVNAEIIHLSPAFSEETQSSTSQELKQFNICGKEETPEKSPTKAELRRKIHCLQKMLLRKNKKIEKLEALLNIAGIDFSDKATRTILKFVKPVKPARIVNSPSKR